MKFHFSYFSSLLMNCLAMLLRTRRYVLFTRSSLHIVGVVWWIDSFEPLLLLLNMGTNVSRSDEWIGWVRETSREGLES
jgi:hypothetical protein